MSRRQTAEGYDGYVRVSDVGKRKAEDDGTGYQSPDDQRRRIKATAARHGVALSGVFAVEEDVSGKLRAQERSLGHVVERVERGESAGIIVADLDRLHRPKQKDEAELWDRMEAAGGRILTGDGVDTGAPGGEMLYRIKGAIARDEWKRKRDAWSRAVRRMIDAGQHHTGTVPIGYRRIKDEGDPMHGRLERDPATRALVVELFERRARGQSWVSLARWMAEQGHPRTESGVKSTIHNPAYLGQARYGELVKEGAHEALVGKGLWRRANEPGRKSSRDGRLTKRFLMQGVAVCASCGRAMYLSGGRRTKDYAHYVCRRLECDEHAYARAEQLDTFVLNSIEEALTGVDADGERVGPGVSEEAWRAATFVPKPGGDDSAVAEAEAALDDARSDLDALLANTTLLRVLGEERYNEAASDYVAAVNKAGADLEAAREASSGSFELVGRLWNTEWGWAERKEWLERMVRSVVVSRGREALSHRVAVELR